MFYYTASVTGQILMHCCIEK